MSALRKWLIIFAALLPQIFAWGLSVSALTMWMVPWMKTYSATHAEITATSMCMILAIGGLSPLGGYIAEKLQVRDLLAAGLLLTLVTYLLLSRATAMWQITVLCSVPLASGLVLTSAMMGQILAVKLFHPKPGLAIGIVSIGTAVGGALAPQVIGKLLSVHIWQTALVLLAAAGAVLLPCILVIIPKLSQSPDINERRARGPVRLPIPAILADRVFLGSVMIVMTLNLLFDAVFFNLGPYLHEAGVAATRTATILSVSAVPAFIGTLTVAPLADRVDYRLILLFSLALVGSGVAATATGANFEAMLIIVPAMSFAIGGMFSLLPVIMSQRFGRHSFERANGLCLPFTFLGGVGPFIAGFGRDQFGSYPHTFAAMLGLIVIPALGLLLLTRTNGSRTDLPEELQQES